MPTSVAQVVEALHEDLGNARGLMHFYLNSCVYVQGPSRASLRATLYAMAGSEMQCVLDTSDLVLGLGGAPSAKTVNIGGELSSPKTVLSTALATEEKVLADCASHRKMAQELGGVKGARVEAFLTHEVARRGAVVDFLRQAVVGA